jgi:hypothetical protein
MGGNDKQGFGMKQGVLTNQRVRLLMSPGQQCFRGYGRRNGQFIQSLESRQDPMHLAYAFTLLDKLLICQSTVFFSGDARAMLRDHNTLGIAQQMPLF